jgi:hypothetical protein
VNKTLGKFRAVVMVPQVVEFHADPTMDEATKEARRLASTFNNARSLCQAGGEEFFFPILSEVALMEGELVEPPAPDACA